MKLIVDNYYSKSLFTVIPVNAPTTETTTREFVKKVRATAMKMTLPNGSRDFNALGVMTRSDMNDLHLLIDADLNAQLDVDILAKAFNMDKTTFLGHVTIIDGFASDGLEAVLIDKDWYMVYDNLLKLETIRNPRGLYWNYYFHVWQTMSASRFANAVAFVSGDVKPVTQVIIDPTILAIKQGQEHEFIKYVRTTVDGDYAETWSVVGTTGTSIAVGTSITDGVLTVANTQVGELLVKLEVDISSDQDGSDVVTGESIVTVMPK